jgi:hypothetical protein
VPIGNRFGDEGGKAVGDALKDNTTLSSLSLNLQGEWLLLRVFRILRPYCWKAHRFSFSTTSQENCIDQQVCVELIHTLIELCHLTSLEISLEGLPARVLVSYA